MRLLIAFDELGVNAPEAAPRMAGDLGTVLQTQANLMWRLSLDMDAWNGDTAPTTLYAAISSLLGIEGGLATFTRVGARAVLTRFVVPRLNGRRLAEEGR